MKLCKTPIVFPIVLFLLITGACVTENHDSSLSEGFQNPPPSARPYVWWHWMSGNITREGITADLEAMAESGIGGAWIFNLGESHGCEVPCGSIAYMSDEWMEMVKFAVSEAQRLDLTLGMKNCSGWATMGGPWIKPEHGSQRVVSTFTNVDGGKHIVAKLAQPEANLNYYRDIAFIAYPTISNDKYRVNQWKNKAAQQGWRLGQQPDLTSCPADAAIALAGIVDVSEHVSEDGTLTWEAPKGSWTILRLGHTPLGTQNFPALESGRGLEVDKLNRAAVDVHWKNGIKPILDNLGPMAGQVFNDILIDSYEAGMNHWSPGMREEFIDRRGYDPMPYFPALTGRLVEDGPTTERFLWDFRRTVSELYTENFYGYVADLCHKNGMKFSTEPYYGMYEFLAIAAKADMPMGEFWVGGDHNSDLKLASSVAHINGGNLVGAEAYTAMPYAGKWQNYPGKFKALGDFAFTEGINRFVLHAYVHQPFGKNVLPGMTFGQWGSHLDRNVTWFKPGKAWFDYLNRSQYLLQHGEFAADVLCFAGEAIPNGGVEQTDLKEAGYDYDACGTDIFANLEVDKGDILLPSGRRYLLLVMPDTPFQSPQIVRKVRDLVADGATVLSSKPKHSPTLTGFPDSEKEMLSIAEQVWDNCDGISIKSNRHGEGQVFDGLSPAQVLAELDILPAVKLPGGLAWIHRRTNDTDIFFLSNQSDNSVDTIAFFRTTGKKPEFFDAEQGTVKDAPYWTVEAEYTRVSLKLDKEKSVFVVFRHPGKPKTVQPIRSEVADLPEPLNLKGPWDIHFQENRGAPKEALFTELISWTEHKTPGIKYFSGTATYKIDFDLTGDYLKKDRQVWLDLGDVAVIAEVRVNGKDVGTLWHKPFKREISESLKSGSNTLEIDVTNLWVNRLIGDEQYPKDCKYNDIDMGWYSNRALTAWPEWISNIEERPEKKRVTFTSWKHWDKDDELLPSGLIGPVTLRCARMVPLP